MASIIPMPKKSLKERLSILDSISDKMNKKYEKTVMGRMGRDERILDALTITTIPTPSIALNKAIGGGFPRKRMTLLAGLPDSGKTSLVLETIGKNMKESPDFVAAWLESENSLEKDYICHTFGIDPKRFYYMKFNPEMGAEETMDVIQSILSAGVIDLFCINSLKCLIPTQEVESSFSDALVGVQARFNARLSRKFSSIVADSGAAFVIVTHLSTQIGSLSRDPLIISGGHAIAYWSSITLDLRKKSIAPTDPIQKEEGVKIGVTVRKNHCTPWKNVYVKLDYFAVFGEGIEQYLTLLPIAMDIGVMEQKGPWLYWKDSKGDIVQKFSGKQGYRTYFKENPDKWQTLLSQIDGDIPTESLSDEEISAIVKEEGEIKKRSEEQAKRSKN